MAFLGMVMGGPPEAHVATEKTTVPTLEAHILDEGPELEEHVSQQLICPISHRIMDVPVVTPSGHTYDRASISAWLERRAVDPLSLAPLHAASLYPNRALQEELLEQLQRLTASEDPHLAAAAQAKLGVVRGAQRQQSSQTDAGEEVARLDLLLGSMASLSTWLEMLAWEQLLVFLTSFGTVLCLSLDTMDSIRSRTGSREARPPLLTNFLRMATWPGLQFPAHWSSFGRLTVMTLRCGLLLPVGSMVLVFTLGGLLSIVRFASRCLEVRRFEMERMLRNNAFTNTLHIFSSIVGLSSFGLFMRLYLDHRRHASLISK